MSYDLISPTVTFTMRRIQMMMHARDAKRFRDIAPNATDRTLWHQCVEKHVREARRANHALIYHRQRRH